MRFRTELKGEPGRSVTGIVVPPEVVEALGSGKRPAVNVTINGSYSYRNTVAVMGGAYMIGVSAEHRQAAGIKAGDVIDVDLELDTEKRDVAVPEDLRVALQASPEAERVFYGLSYSRKVLLVNKMNVKNAELRSQRIVDTITQLLSSRV